MRRAFVLILTLLLVAPAFHCLVHHDEAAEHHSREQCPICHQILGNPGIESPESSTLPEPTATDSVILADTETLPSDTVGHSYLSRAPPRC